MIARDRECSFLLKGGTDEAHAHRREAGHGRPDVPVGQPGHRGGPRHAPDASAADAEAAVAAARRAFDATTWSTDVAFRTRCLDQLHEALTEHQEELRELTIADVGAPRQITYGAQLDEPIEIVRYYADLLPSLPAHRGSRPHGVPRPAAPPLGGEGGRGRRRRDHRLQLPDPARAGQAVPRARGRVHGRAQGRPGHAADHARAGRADRHGDRHPARRGQRPVLLQTWPSARCSPRRPTWTSSPSPAPPPPAAGSWRPPAPRSSGSSSSSAASPPWSCSTTPTSHGRHGRGVRDLLARRAGLRDHHPDAGAQGAARRDRAEVAGVLGHVTYGDPATPRTTWAR